MNKQMDVIGIRIEMPDNQPIVLLQERHGNRFLPVWVGEAEASAIALAHQEIEVARPLTHDLFVQTLEILGQGLREVVINDFQEGIYYARIVFSSGQEISARPSDAIALALRGKCDIYCEEGVLAEGGITVEQETEAEELQRFREFLDDVSAEDFE